MASAADDLFCGSLFDATAARCQIFFDFKLFLSLQRPEANCETILADGLSLAATGRADPPGKPWPNVKRDERADSCVPEFLMRTFSAAALVVVGCCRLRWLNASEMMRMRNS